MRGAVTPPLHMPSCCAEGQRSFYSRYWSTVTQAYKSTQLLLLQLLDSKRDLKTKKEIRGPKTALATLFTNVEIGTCWRSGVVR
jgi:hypothetical protein